ncbi:GGDEF domain-containing protein [Frigidibacter sp. RF13]|uniref:GGDEF domain-containing protein n=1 Tax=Frigidibacter sp. RF13 TaxID=2997340 RepID=UPI00226DCC1C|nr:GGDEF domain-containing protein [Frigidibacter sp. RF13]MCY1126314.1 GGDEF domain-containing protein [Frigidibacter sp. RF13]
MDGLTVQDAALVGTDALGRLMPMYLWVTPNGLVRAVGPTLKKLCGAGPLIGTRFLDLFEVEKPRALLSMADVEAFSGQRILVTLKRGQGTTLRGQVQPLDGGQGWILNLSFGISVAEAVRDYRLTNADFAPTDLTVELLYLTEVKAAVMGELAALNRRLEAARAASEAQALTDALTGLGNRRALDAELIRACTLAARGEGQFALLHLDLDFFKAVNDTLGHAAGDLVLTEVAGVLREETRKSDTIARVGGDEFVILLRGETDPDRVERIGARIISELERPILYEGQPCRISGSIGVTLSRFYASPDPEMMHSDADEATYASKRNGRGRCTVWDGSSRPAEPEPGA